MHDGDGDVERDVFAVVEHVSTCRFKLKSEEQKWKRGRHERVRSEN